MYCSEITEKTNKCSHLSTATHTVNMHVAHWITICDDPKHSNIVHIYWGRHHYKFIVF